MRHDNMAYSLVVNLALLVKRPTESGGLATGFVAPRQESDNERIRQLSHEPEDQKIEDQSNRQEREEGGVDKPGFFHYC